MFIVFGWGRQTKKDYGPTLQYKCSNCNNKEYWHLLRISTYFTLFLIPVFPYETKYYLMCPICTSCAELEWSKVHKLKPLAEANKLLLEQKINKDEYSTRIKSIFSETKEIEAEEMVESSRDNNTERRKYIKKEKVVPRKTKQFCGVCGSKIERNAKYCSGCGNKL